MFVLLELSVILAYMINGYIGLGLMSIMVLSVITQKKRRLYRWFELMIISLPMAMIGIAGMNMNHIFSWYNLYLLLFLIKLVSEGKRFSANSLIYIATSLLSLLLCSLLSNNLQDSLIESSQILMMIIPVALVYGCNLTNLFSNKEKIDLISKYVQVGLALAVAMIIQYWLNTRLGVTVGFIEHSGNRISYFCLFKGPSIPMFVGSCLIIRIIDFLNEKRSMQKIMECTIMIIAIVLNSSRAGLFCILSVATLLVLTNMYQKLREGKITSKPIIVTIALFLVGVLGVNYLTSLRDISFFDSNGRDNLIRNGISIWLHSPKNIFFGEGFSGGLWVGNLSPHNMIVQTLSECGLLFSLVGFYGLFVLLRKNWHNVYVFCAIFIIVYGMFVTEFYVNCFTTVLLILIILTNRENVFERRRK